MVSARKVGLFFPERIRILVPVTRHEDDRRGSRHCFRSSRRGDTPTAAPVDPWRTRGPAPRTNSDAGRSNPPSIREAPKSGAPGELAEGRGVSPLERRSNRTTFLREPCVGSREGAGEASVAVRMGRANEHRNGTCSGCRGFRIGRRQHRWHRYEGASKIPVEMHGKERRFANARSQSISTGSRIVQRLSAGGNRAQIGGSVAPCRPLRAVLVGTARGCAPAPSRRGEQGD